LCLHENHELGVVETANKAPTILRGFYDAER